MKKLSNIFVNYMYPIFLNIHVILLKVHLVKKCMLALVDLYLCIHRILLHYLIKICVIIFLNIFCNKLLLPAKPRLQKNSLESPRPTLTFVTSSVNHQSPKISQIMDNGMYLPLSASLTHNIITYFTQYQLTHVQSQ